MYNKNANKCDRYIDSKDIHKELKKIKEESTTSKLRNKQLNNDAYLNKAINNNHNKLPFHSQLKLTRDKKECLYRQSKPVVKIDQQQIVQDFFEDNQRRYPAENTDNLIEPVPILKIRPPNRIRHLFVKQQDSMTLSKEPFTTSSSSPHTHLMDEHNTQKYIKLSVEQLDIKKQMMRDSTRDMKDIQIKCTKESENQSVFYSNANGSALSFEHDINKLQYENEEELHMKKVMLETSCILKQSERLSGNEEYMNIIYANIFDEETHYLVNLKDIEERQREITWRLRSLIIDWIVQVHYSLGLLSETLFSAVNIIDRFLSHQSVALNKFQLMAITALYIAAKVEECGGHPSAQQFAQMTDGAFVVKDIIQAEMHILRIIDYQLCYPNMLIFLKRLYKSEAYCDEHTKLLARYFLEVSIIEHRLIGTRGSKLAAAALWMSRKMLFKGNWNHHLVRLSGYKRNDLKPIIEIMIQYLSKATRDTLFTKWSNQSFLKASIFVQEWIHKYCDIQTEES
ncbi:cyclin-like protein [Cokeromyces recurvatus]|uniref:cyclin-like protein n=1 Tax=Cokeromyces recurvatus TaxID=90255 RepID=UPI00221F081D|nr:cyclin-like protein [Cokeromyces recurvatus]KAI7902300.1 cyclin-like protein [Cokeromyces recurvatus]